MMPWFREGMMLMMIVTKLRMKRSYQIKLHIRIYIYVYIYILCFFQKCHAITALSIQALHSIQNSMPEGSHMVTRDVTYPLQSMNPIF